MTIVRLDRLKVKWMMISYFFFSFISINQLLIYQSTTSSFQIFYIPNPKYANISENLVSYKEKKKKKMIILCHHLITSLISFTISYFDLIFNSSHLSSHNLPSHHLPSHFQFQITFGRKIQESLQKGEERGYDGDG